MSNDLNQCQFIGRLGKDPEIRHMPNGGAVASFSIACGEQWKDKQTGEKQERTEWVNLTAFGKLAEIIGEYLKKGSQVYVSGKFKTDKYQDKETGKDRYSTKVIINQMQMLGSRDSGSSAQSGARGNNAPAPSGGGSPGGGSLDDFNDSIPF